MISGQWGVGGSGYASGGRFTAQRRRLVINCTPLFLLALLRRRVGIGLHGRILPFGCSAGGLAQDTIAKRKTSAGNSKTTAGEHTVPLARRWS